MIALLSQVHDDNFLATCRMSCFSHALSVRRRALTLPRSLACHTHAERHSAAGTVAAHAQVPGFLFYLSNSSAVFGLMGSAVLRNWMTYISFASLPFPSLPFRLRLVISSSCCLRMLVPVVFPGFGSTAFGLRKVG